MKYKTPELCEELRQCCKHLVEVVYFFEALSMKIAGIEPTVTRVFEHICGSSGVHEAHRGCDLRDETVALDGSKHFLYTPEQAQKIVREINLAYPRTDGYATILHHSFDEGPFHFHVQVGPEWSEANQEGDL